MINIDKLLKSICLGVPIWSRKMNNSEDGFWSAWLRVAKQSTSSSARPYGDGLGEWENNHPLAIFLGYHPDTRVLTHNHMDHMGIEL